MAEDRIKELLGVLGECQDMGMVTQPVPYGVLLRVVRVLSEEIVELRRGIREAKHEATLYRYYGGIR